MSNFLAAYILHHYLKAGRKGILATTKTNTFFQFWYSQMDLQDSYSPATLPKSISAILV